MDKKFNRFLLLVYLVSFIISWMFVIFWLDKNEFDFEFREKETTTAIIFNLDTNQVVEELYEGKKVNVHDVDFIEYSYVVNGGKFEWGSDNYGVDYSISDEIEIEYVKCNPLNSKIKGSPPFSFNYFVRNLILVIVISIIVMLFLTYVLDFLNISSSSQHYW